LLENQRGSTLATLPGSLEEALDELERDQVIRDALGPHVYERFIHAKREEWEDYRLEVTSWELNKYLTAY
jgi:glutamine synthetase